MNVLSICDEPSVLEIMNIIVLLINIIKVVVPIALIIVLMLKLTKAVTDNNTINWMLKQKYGKVNVVNDSEISAIEKSLGSNFAGRWTP